MRDFDSTVERVFFCVDSMEKWFFLFCAFLRQAFAAFATSFSLSETRVRAPNHVLTAVTQRNASFLRKKTGRRDRRIPWRSSKRKIHCALSRDTKYSRHFCHTRTIAHSDLEILLYNFWCQKFAARERYIFPLRK